ncbi:MAG: hypothetical protein DRP59_01935 [Spirochaetes bacterium]|nr:MAG: hypothetical protein DRP59_01935 [Spirochaetota bacterium]
MKNPDHPPDCLKCVYFKVTWEYSFPRSCTLFGVKSKTLPSMAVYRATGKHCPSFKKSGKIKT